MGFRINTNIAALNAHSNSVMNNVGLSRSLNSLSSGLRINRSADDSSGLAIANKLSAQSQGLGQAIKNANDGIGLIQTADGALQEYGNILQRVRVLATQASNDTQDTTSRANIQLEVKALMGAANDIATTTRFNGTGVLNNSGGATGSKGSFVFHTGAYSTETQTVAIGNMTVSGAVGTAGDVGGAASTYGVTSRASAEHTIAVMDAAIQTVDSKRAVLGAAQNKLQSTVRNISVTQVNVRSAESQIRDVDFAAESARYAKHNILAQSGSYAMAQANAVQKNVLRLLQ